MKKRFFIMLIIALVFGPLMQAKTSSPIMTADSIDFYEAGGNYYCYPWLYTAPPVQTPAPEGYVPVHLEHYGRHGSRWHIGDYNYDVPYRLLSKAHNDGKLTPFGENVFFEVAKIRDAFKEGRDGELSDKGALQHKGIGKRMALNYPEIFTDSTHIDARSTIVIRSILSMFNALNGIQSVVPEISITTDASMADMWYMNYNDEEVWAKKHIADSVYLKPFSEKHANKGQYMVKLFNDMNYARDSIGSTLFNPLFSLLVNTQSHLEQPWLVEELFTIDEARERWAIRNANWFLQCGNSQLTDNRMPYSQVNLLKNIIESTDSALNTPYPVVNLRYGHDTIVLPLSVLLELDNFGEEINDLEELITNGWHDYLSIPMGGNIQIIIYNKPASKNADDALVKVMLNEVETTLPLDRDNGPYYKWTDFKEYYLGKIKKSNLNL